MQARLHTDSIFFRQNIWLKLFILLMGSISALAVPVKGLYYLVLITILYLLLSPPILKSILRGLKIMLPFMAGYSLIATLSGLLLGTILIFLLRISIMVVMVSIFSASFSMNRFLEDSRFLQQNASFKPLLFYMVATLTYLKNFRHYYQSRTQLETIPNMISKLLSNLIDSIHDNWKKKNEIQAESEILLNTEYQHSVFLSKANILGCIYLTMLILSLSI